MAGSVTAATHGARTPNPPSAPHTHTDKSKRATEKDTETKRI
eukprot:COSAG05_NODE_12617_length_461_cov_0.845304_1_plen_41_part_10